MKWINIIWRFGRPHTLVGSIVSVTALHILAEESLVFRWSFILAMVSAIGANLFITGYNQLVDIELDKITKPNLPLASGELSPQQGKIIISGALIIALMAALFLGIHFTVFIGLISLIGFLYSWKKVYFKKHHIPAATAIFIVRGFLVNIGFYSFFKTGQFELISIPDFIWVLTAFVIFFSLGIAWFKDIPDRKGDAGLKIQSLVIRYGVKRAFTLGIISVLIGYVVVSSYAVFGIDGVLNEAFLFIGNTALSLSFLAMAFFTEPTSRVGIKRFYMVFWVLFALEYLLFASAVFI